MSFLEHLEELRARLIRCALAVVGGTIVCWFFREDIRTFLEAPLFDAWSKVDGLPPPQPLNFSGMLEPFVAYLKLSAIGGVFVASPVILYNLWCFVSPGLYPRERKVALPFVLVSTLLFVGGASSAYYTVFPIGFRFFLEFAAGTEVEEAEVEVEVTEMGPVAPPDPVPAALAGAIREVGARPEPAAGTDAGGGADAGTDARGGGETDAGTGETVDAGTATEAEADADAGPPAGEVAAPSPVPPGKPVRVADAGPEPDLGSAPSMEDGASWYEWLLFRFFRSNCRELNATADARGGVLLRFVWQERRCGPPPDLLRVDRGETRLAQAAWSEPLVLAGGRISRELLDPLATPGRHTYEVGYASQQSSTGKLAPVLMVKDYLSFAIRLLLAFGLVFELPVLISFLAIAGIVNYRQLLGFSRWFIVIAVIVAAILTPPDVLTQIMLAVPLIVLYYLSVLFAYFFGRKSDEP